MIDKHQFLMTIPEVAALLDDADVIDHKTIEGDVPLRQFVARLLSYQPGWVTALYRVRAVLVRFIGFRQGGIPRPEPLDPADLPFTPGAQAYFFTTRIAEEDRYWIGEVDDPHLRAILGTVVESLADGRTRYHVITLVYFHQRVGRLYYTLIQPFHHIIVRLMMRHAVQRTNIRG